MANIIISAGIVWVLLSTLSFIQFVHLRSVYNVLSEKGRIVTGQDRKFLTKYRVFAAVSKDGIVADARVLKLVQIITLPKLFECPLLVGLDIDSFEPSALDVDPRIQLAAKDMKRSWISLKPTLNRDIPSIASQPCGEEEISRNEFAEQEVSHNKHLHKAVSIINGLLTNSSLKINKKPLLMLLEAVFASDHALCFNTDEVIADKASQLRTTLVSGNTSIPKADGLIETIFRLITQREREAAFRRNT